MTGVYFLRHDAFVKVGYSRFIARRIKDLISREAILLGVIPCALKEARELEAAWHQRLAAWRHSGEWFHASPELLAMVQAHVVAPSKNDTATGVVAGFFDKAVRKQLHAIALDQSKTRHALMVEAINDLFAKYRLPEIAE